MSVSALPRSVSRRFMQLDVFADTPLKGNPLAVVLDAQGLDDAAMRDFARWTDLAETTFVLPPTTPEADYRVRIFTPDRELPFAGHPTLGTCHAWLQAGGRPHGDGDTIVQQCGLGLVPLRRHGEAGARRLAFAAPPLRRTGPLDEATLARIVRVLGIAPQAVLRHQWVCNGPSWAAVMLGSAQEVLDLKPDFADIGDLEIGVVGPYPPGGACRFELRAFLCTPGVQEDPVTGSLNAGVAQWLISAGLAPPRYVASQGTVLGCAGRVHVEQAGGQVWIGGRSHVCVDGHVTL
jgi:PhzF family phenazine biosynthesis protein